MDIRISTIGKNRFSKVRETSGNFTSTQGTSKSYTKSVKSSGNLIFGWLFSLLMGLLVAIGKELSTKELISVVSSMSDCLGICHWWSVKIGLWSVNSQGKVVFFLFTLGDWQPCRTVQLSLSNTLLLSWSV